MVHDFAVTKRHIIVPDQQMIFNIFRMFVGESPVLYDREKIPRFGVMPRNDTDDGRMTWIDVPGCFCFHLWNAWEDPDTNEVIVVGSCMTPPDGIFNEYPDKQPLRSILSEIRLNLTTGASARTEIFPGLNLEAGQINRSYVGRRSRYAYMAIAEPWARVSGIAKVNLESREIVAKFLFDEGCYGGEPYFVARSPPTSSAEDDGYVVTFVNNENTGKSEFVILDARTPSLDVVASVKLPSRVPYGFHGTFITGEELARQRV